MEMTKSMTLTVSFNPLALMIKKTNQRRRSQRRKSRNLKTKRYQKQNNWKSWNHVVGPKLSPWKYHLSHLPKKRAKNVQFVLNHVIKPTFSILVDMPLFARIVLCTCLKSLVKGVRIVEQLSKTHLECFNKTIFEL